jgi:protein O-mannosyl-transferase
MSRAPTTIAASAFDSATRWRVIAVAAVLILAALGAYWNSLNVPLLLDDRSSITDNPSLRHLGQIGDVLSPPPTGTTAARPLLNLTFALNYAAGGTSVRGYHAVNLLVHICAGLALLGIVRRTLLSPGLRPRFGEAALPLAAFAVLLWTLHPLQTEAVTYISQRAESLMGLFYLLTLYCFIRSIRSGFTEDNEGHEVSGPKHGSLLSSLPSVRTPGSEPRWNANKSWLILSVATCFCGMATKQVMVTAPVVVLLYDRAFVSGSFRAALANRRWYYVSLTTTWLLLGLLMHHSSLAAISVGFQSGVSWPTYAATELRVVTDYLRLAFWPHPLVFDYGSEILVTDPLTVVPRALIIAALLVGVALAWRRWPMVGYLGCWFILILAPTSTVVPIADQPMAESRMYLPLAAVVVFVTLLGYALVRRRVFVGLGLVAVGLGALTIHRNHAYRSGLSIWEDTVAREPQSSRAHCNLASEFMPIPGRLPDAIAHFEEALRLNPTFAEAHCNLGIALAQLPGRLADAIAHCEEAVRLKPAYAEAHYDLALELADVPGRFADAIAHYEEALRLKPDYVEAHNNLALQLAKIPGRLPDAIRHSAAALRLRPDFAEAHNNLGVELAKIPGRSADAIAHYEEALRLKPNYAEAHNNLGIELAKIPGRMADAIAHYEAALRFDPDSAEAHSNLADALTEIPGRLADAFAHYEAALHLKPDIAEVHNNFALELAKIPGRSSEAIAHFETALRLKPDYAEAHRNLAIALAKTPGRLTDAIAHFEEAVRLKPDFADARNNLAVAYAESGRWDAAIEQLEIATRLDPASTVFRDNLEKLKARRKQ